MSPSTRNTFSWDFARAIAKRLDTELGFRPSVDEFYRNPLISALVNAFYRAGHVRSPAVAIPPHRAQRAAFKVGQPGYRRDLDDHRTFVQLEHALAEVRRAA